MSCIQKIYIKSFIVSIIYIILITISSIAYAKSTDSSSIASSKCKLFMDDVKSFYQLEKLGELSVNSGNFLPFAIDLKYVSKKKNENDSSEQVGTWTVKRDDKGNIFIGSPLPPIKQPNFFPGDKIIEINGKKPSSFSDEQIKKFFYFYELEKDKVFNLKIKRKNEIINIGTKLEEREYYPFDVDIEIFDIEVDQLNNQVKAFMSIEVIGSLVSLGKYAKKHFLKKDGDDYYSSGCIFSDEEMNEMQLPRLQSIAYLNNLKFEDNSNLKRHHTIDIMAKEMGGELDYATIESISTMPVIIKNNFQLKSFPFDKQIITFSIRGSSPDDYIANTDYSHLRLSNFVKKTKIPGWEILGYEIEQTLVEDPLYSRGDFISALDFSFVIQRNFVFYIFKIILPILLILLICWSVLWINPIELESRLTITIVCLLSLIAYNFVIDKDIPKLSYLTVMDYIILVSYVYAAIPNFLSIASFRFQKTNQKLCNNIESIGKKFGPISYILLIFAIIIYAINDNPFTARFLAGLT